jgi:hypothetical protein
MAMNIQVHFFNFGSYWFGCDFTPSYTPCPISLSISKFHTLHTEDKGSKFSETVVLHRNTARRNNPEDQDLNLFC